HVEDVELQGLVAADDLRGVDGGHGVVGLGEIVAAVYLDRRTARLRPLREDRRHTRESTLLVRRTPAEVGIAHHVAGKEDLPWTGGLFRRRRRPAIHDPSDREAEAQAENH